MKKFIVPVLSICFFASCSTEDTPLNTVDTTTIIDSASDVFKKNLIIAENPANAFDYVGQIYVDVLDGYCISYGGPEISPVAIGNVWLAAGSNAAFVSLANNYPSLNEGRVLWVAQNVNNTQVIINSSGISDSGKQKLSQLISMVDSFEGLPYSEVHNSLKVFERQISQNTSLSQNDIRVVLTYCSISRFGIAYGDVKKKWWKNTKLGIVGSAGAANPVESVMMSVTSNLGMDN